MRMGIAPAARVKVHNRPHGNFGGNVLIYGLPDTVGTGPVNILDLNGSISHTLLFTSTQLIAYSHDNGGLLADVGPTVLFSNAAQGQQRRQRSIYLCLRLEHIPWRLRRKFCSSARCPPALRDRVGSIELFKSTQEKKFRGGVSSK